MGLWGEGDKRSLGNQGWKVKLVVRVKKVFLGLLQVLGGDGLMPVKVWSRTKISSSQRRRSAHIYAREKQHLDTGLGWYSN
jgi:hypothetical protein